MPLPPPPQYTHNCATCRYLGRYYYDGALHDLYYCENALGGPTVLARYGNESSQYLSAQVSVVRTGTAHGWYSITANAHIPGNSTEIQGHPLVAAYRRSLGPFIREINVADYADGFVPSRTSREAEVCPFCQLAYAVSHEPGVRDIPICQSLFNTNQIYCVTAAGEQEVVALTVGYFVDEGYLAYSPGSDTWRCTTHGETQNLTWCRVCRQYTHAARSHDHCPHCEELRANCDCVRCDACCILTSSLCDCGGSHCENCHSDSAVVHFKTRRMHKFEGAASPENPSTRLCGAEIEFCDATSWNSIDSWCNAWWASVVTDGSVSGVGAEIVTSPAAGVAWVQMCNEFGRAASACGLDADRSCGLHLHVDCSDFKWWDMRKLILLYERIEGSLFRMIDPSRRSSDYCEPNGDDLKRLVSGAKSTKEMKKAVFLNLYEVEGRDIPGYKKHRRPNCRYAALNLHSWFYRGTVEFRMHHGTVNGETIKNWGILCTGIVDYAARHSEAEIRALTKSNVTLLKTAPTKAIAQFITRQRDHFLRSSLEE